MITDSTNLRREAQSFTLFLVNRLPTDEVADKYHLAHQKNPVYSHGDPFDLWMVRMARTSPRLTWLLDTYARCFRPRGLLRHKLILTYAILETTAPFFELLERNPQRSPPAALLALTGILALSLVGLLGGLALALPVRMFFLILPLRTLGMLLITAEFGTN